MNDSYRNLIASPRVSTPTRQVLAERSRPDDPEYVPQALDAVSFDMLRALVARVIPQSPPHSIDLAARIDQRLARGMGDGWRFDALPSDPIAYRRGLRTLDNTARRRFGLPFVELLGRQQDALLTLVAAGDGDKHGNEESADWGFGDRYLDAAELRAWFEEACADAVRQYVAHPNTLARLGYSGIANGGDGLPKSGFIDVGLGEREAWEPLPSTGEHP
jgi:hypothetical protein